MLDYVAGAAITLGLWLAFMVWVHYDLKVRLRNRRAASGKFVDYIKRGEGARTIYHRPATPVAGLS